MPTWQLYRRAMRCALCRHAGRITAGVVTPSVAKPSTEKQGCPSSTSAWSGVPEHLQTALTLGESALRRHEGGRGTRLQAP